MRRARRILTVVAVMVLAMVGTASAQTALSAQDVTDGVFGNSEGRAGLVQFAEGFHAQQDGHARHWNNNVHVTSTAEGAEGTTYLQLWNVGVRPQTIIVTGIYHDTLVKTADGWRFKTRRVEVDRPADGGQ